MRSLRRLQLLAMTMLILLASSSIAFANNTKNGLFPDEIITPKDLLTKMQKKENFLLLDARNKKSYMEQHIQGAILPKTPGFLQQEELFANGIIQKAPDQDASLKEFMSQYPRDLPIVTYCNAECHASAVLVLRLKGLGFKNVQSMEEGIQFWESQKYPVEPPSTNP